MTHQTRTFTIADPRSFDGDPFEVADRAVAQAEGLAKLAHNAAKDAFVMARNAEMERELMRGDDPQPMEWEDGPHGRRFQEAMDRINDTITDLALLRKAAGFNPKTPLNGA